jgi:hypothetical protein
VKFAAGRERETTDRLETPKQLAARIGLSERQVRHLIQTRQLEHVMIGCRVHIPVGAFARFIEATGVAMSRRNQGPRLRWLDERGCFYIRMDRARPQPRAQHWHARPPTSST